MKKILAIVSIDGNNANKNLPHKDFISAISVWHISYANKVIIVAGRYIVPALPMNLRLRSHRTCFSTQMRYFLLVFKVNVLDGHVWPSCVFWSTVHLSNTIFSTLKFKDLHWAQFINVKAQKQWTNQQSRLEAGQQLWASV